MLLGLHEAGIEDLLGSIIEDYKGKSQKSEELVELEPGLAKIGEEAQLLMELWNGMQDMTSAETRISKKDWERVTELSCDLVNASEKGEDLPKHRQALFDYLDELEERYGPEADTVATRADFTEDDTEACRLLLKAYQLAESQNDYGNMIMIADSVCNRLVDSETRIVLDGIELRLAPWLDTYGSLVDEHGSDEEWEDYVQVRREAETVGRE